jgi:tetratricopeptide (TPR) repeat protein
MPDVQGPTDGNDIALKAVGMNSAEELAREMARLSDASLKAHFEAAYRKTYAVRQAQRAYREAAQLAGEIIAKRPDFAPAYRVEGYARFNSGNPDGALASYRKAVELDPNYGEAQYALAFLYVMTDVAAGKVHFQKAMALGIKDEMDIGPRYFGLWQ